VSPPNGATNVGINAQVHWRFDEPMNPISFIPETLGAETYSLNFSNDNQEVRYIPHVPFEPVTEIKVDAPNAEDYAGNALNPTSTTFTTQADIDTVAPTVIHINPTDGATDVATNAQVTVEMSEPIDPISINSNTFYITDTKTSLRVAGKPILDKDGKTLHFIADKVFAVGRLYRISVSSIYDISSNTYSSNSNTTFTTTFKENKVAPTIESSSIVDGQTEIPTNTRLRIRFNEPINELSIENISLKQDAKLVKVSYHLATDHQTVTLQPVNPLKANSEYQLTVEDVEGISRIPLASLTKYSFITTSGVDTQVGSVIEVDPYNNAKGIPSNAVITVQLSERVDPTTVTNQSFNILTDNKPIEGARTLSDDGLTLTFTPKQALKPSATHSIQISYSPYLTDLSGNKINSVGYSFTTGVSTDDVTPTIETISILADSSDVPVNAQLTVNLSEPVSSLCVNTNTFKLTSNGKALEGALTLSTDHQLLTFVPTQALTKNTEYTLAVEGLCDFVGNTLAAHSQSFTTKDSDIADTRGATVQMIPASKSTNVPVNSVVIFEFDEAIDPSSIDPEKIYLRVGSSRIAGNLTVNSTRHKITFTSLNPLPGNSKINTFLSGIKDLAGNLSSFYSPNNYFETADEVDVKLPEILAVTPNDKSMDIHPSTPVVITFSESLDPNTINKKNFILYANGQVLNNYGLSQSSDNRTITLSSSYDSLPVESTISVIVTDDVKDLSGNRIKDSISIFTTSVADDGTRPKITTAYPGNGAKDVYTNSTIILQANESLDGTLLEEVFHISQNGVLINGTKELIKNDYVVKFTPEQPLLNDALIEVFLDSQMTDQSGNALSNYQTQFRTAIDPTNVKLKLLTSTPINQSTIGLVNPVIDLQFNKAVDPNTINKNTVTFGIRYLYTGGIGGGVLRGDYQELEAKLILLKGNRVLRIQPVKALTTGKIGSGKGFYSYAIKKGVSDLQGNSLIGFIAGDNISRRFYTQANAITNANKPSVAGVSPPNGATNVGINAQVHWRFDEPMNPISFIPETLGAETYSLSFSNDNQEVRYIPHVPFEPVTEIKVDAPNAEDYAGNALNPTSTTFTTQADIDTVAPTVIHINPTNGATDVATNAQVTVEMSEPIDPISINSNTFYIQSESKKIAGKSTLDQDGKTLRFIADSVFSVGKIHYVYLQSIKDINGNITDYYRNTSFTTTTDEDKTAPTIESINISEGQTNVPTNTRLQIKFSEVINNISLKNISLKNNDEITKTTLTLKSDQRTVILQTNNPLKANSEYQLIIENIQDLSGNILKSAITRTFTTESGVDTLAGKVISSSPNDKATDISVDTVLTIQLDKAVDPITVIEKSFRLYENGTNDIITGILSVSSDGLSISFTPTDALKTAQDYTVRASYDADFTDLSGQIFTSFFFSFTTK
ncbi:MAG: Ig-like domain-containing protein, partial [Methylococcales bacterium]|nr:Ig-like domain-containing protein [Methylococcales bacterium]